MANAVQNQVLRHLDVLTALLAEGKSLPDLVGSDVRKQRWLPRVLNQLESQGLVRRGKGGIYQIANEPVVKCVVSLVEPWSSYTETNLAFLAGDAAEIILTKSDERVRVLDVAVYGSIARENRSPRDIDLLIINEGRTLPTHFRYADEFFFDQPPGEDNERYESYETLTALGYRDGSDEEDTVVAAISDIIEPLGLGKVTQTKIDSELALAARLLEKRKEDMHPANYLDVAGVSQLFDVNVLPKDMITDSRYYASRERHEAVGHCKDPMFWANILREGRLYDRATGRFAIPITQKYKDAVALMSPTEPAA